ncbi:MAG: alpha/beta hydrolase [Deltaproteobacteria bacterium]|nr:alpha/beta hydrolase [Deltaproteobacteria bacterium]
MILRALCLLLLVASCGRPVVVPGTTVVSTLEAPEIGETYRITVHLPPEHATDEGRRFAVVYQLDPSFAGLAQLDRTVVAAARLERLSALPPVIVVGVGYDYEDARVVKRGRWRDYSFPVADPEPLTAALYGYGGDAFYRFIRDTLVPRIDADYRTDPAAPRTIVGHSLGGLFVLYALTRGDGVFGRFVAASPTFNFENGAIFAETDAAPALRGRLFLGIGALEGLPPNGYFDAYAERLARHSGVALATERFAGADHLDTITPSVEHGLAWVLAE